MAEITGGDFPKDIIAEYAGGAITKAQFKERLAVWQKGRGIDYKCRGYVGTYGVHLQYRGVTATIRDGILYFINGTYIDGGGNRRYIRERASTAFEFRRRVDFAKNGGANWN